MGAREKNGYPDRTAATWDDYALHSYYADNYALRILGDRTDDVVNTYNISIPWNVGGQDMLPTDVVDGEMVARARRVVQSATVVIDLACLSESLQWLSEQLNLSNNGSRSEFVFGPKRKHAPARQRVGNDTLYDLILARNKHDIALYNWSKRYAVVQCTP